MEALYAAAASALLTASASGLLQARHRRRSAEAAAGARLAAALSEFGFAIDALLLELEQLPPTRQRSAAYWEKISRRAPSLDFVLGRLARFLFGAGLYTAIERMQRASNQLLLEAPEPVLDRLQPMFEHFSTYGERNEDWIAELRAQRADFAALSRETVFGAI